MLVVGFGESISGLNRDEDGHPRINVIAWVIKERITTSTFCNSVLSQLHNNQVRLRAYSSDYQL